nr:MAG TPA: hypothetical protein [Bacteriophage sp.]
MKDGGMIMKKYNVTFTTYEEYGSRGRKRNRGT